MPGPIKPSEVSAHKTATFPEDVFEAFNAEIAASWDGRTAIVNQHKVVERLKSALSIDRRDVFNLGYLNVEESYRAAGWTVEYDKPGYNETYEATFTFTRGKRRP